MIGWQKVWTLALVQFGAEDIEQRILIGLAIAFVLLMIVEGLRATFRPARKRHLSPPEPPVALRVLEAAPRTATLRQGSAGKSAAQPFRARIVGVRTNPKRIKPPVNRHRALRPKISRVKSARRISSLGEDTTAPSAPLSPKC